jgi:photosystem II stability/assembly factor-like uncharacterized protein
MSDVASTAGRGRHGISTLVHGWPSLALVLIVVVAAVYSFSPRPIPHFPDTAIRSDQLLIGGLAMTGTRVVAVGELGNILIADSPRGPWRLASVTPQRGSTLTNVMFDNDIGLAIGHDGQILRSTDRGDTWKEITFNAEQSEPLLGIAGPYDGKIFAFGAFGLLMTSADRGVSWQRVALNITNPRKPAAAPAINPDDIFAAVPEERDYTTSHLNGMTRTAAGELLLVGERGLMLLSSDGGQSWRMLPEIYGGSFFGVLSLPTNGLVAYGMRGNAFVSNDNGRTWKKSTVPEPVSLFGGTVTPSGEVLLVGANNAVFSSKDGGQSYTRISRNERRDVADVLALEGGGRLTAGEGGIRLFEPGAKQGSN